MIRIDLGKNELSKGPPKSIKALLVRVKLPPKVLAYVQKVQFSASLAIVTITATTLAALLPILASQWKASLISQHEEAMKASQTKLAKVADQVVRYSPFQRELQNFEEQKKVVTERLQVVRQLLENRAAPVTVLDTIGQALPIKTWLNTIDLVLGDQALVSLAGQSYSNEEVSDLIDNLSKSIYLTAVSLDDVVTKAIEKTDYRTFLITAKPVMRVEGADAHEAPTAETRALANAPQVAAPSNAAAAKPTPAPNGGAHAK